MLIALGVVAGWCLPAGLAYAAAECTDGINVGFAQPLPAVEVKGEPFFSAAESGKSSDPANDIGLCGAFRDGATLSSFSTNSSTMPYAAPESINAFMDGVGNPRVDRNLNTPFDLSNNVNSMGANSYGDYVTTPECRSGMASTWPGCPFPGSIGTANLRAPFGTRFRGFIDVKPDWVEKPLHFGFYTDDILGVLLVSRTPGTQPVERKYEYNWVISRGAVIGQEKWISTNSVKFKKPGLYGIEVTHASYGGAAVLEFGILMQDTYVDREHGDLALMRVSLDANTCRFDIQRTAPLRYYQSVCGRFHYDAKNPQGSVGACEQCPSINRGQPPKPSDIYPTTYPCPAQRFCNDAAVCSPCVEDVACGPSCLTCVGDTPRCSADPQDPCNVDKARCCQCASTKDCAPGQICNGCECVSPPCCPGYFPVFPNKAKDPNFRLCSPCLNDADCQMKGLDPICDLKNGRCSKAPAPTCLKDGLSVDEQCGPACNINCRALSPARPYCLNNEVCVACRRDADCPSGNFCLSGTCNNPCLDDRHCGASCQNCGIAVTTDPSSSTPEGRPANLPYCKVDTIDGQKVVATGVCVQCREDKECASGQTCVDNRCTPELPCSPACASHEVCFGGTCVQCFADAQCPCGQCIDGRCVDKCSSNQDCEGNQCCQKSTGLCVSGRCGGTAGGALCGCSVASAGVSGARLLSSQPAPPEPFVPGEQIENRSRGVSVAAFAVLLLALALRRRVRRSIGPT